MITAEALHRITVEAITEQKSAKFEEIEKRAKAAAMRGQFSLNIPLTVFGPFDESDMRFLEGLGFECSVEYDSTMLWIHW